MTGPKLDRFFARPVRIGLLSLVSAASLVAGCNALGTKLDETEMTTRLSDAPPIKLTALDGRHLLVMQAPNPGWSFAIDRTSRGPETERIYLTIRRPDPAYMYPQMIVEKQLLTDVREEVPVTVMARLLDANEKGSNNYGRLDTVETFEE